MATVTIAGRELRVWERQAEGGLGKTKRAIQAEIALREAKPQEVPDRLADLVLAYVGDNDGVDAAWLLEHLPADCEEILKACSAATGAKAGPPGEAPRP